MKFFSVLMSLCFLATTFSTLAQTNRGGSGPGNNTANFTIEERSKLLTLKMMLEIQLESVKEVALVTQKNEEAYKSLPYFALAEKRQLRAKNCGDVKSAIGANLLMVSTAMELSKEALAKVEVTDENGQTFQENYLEYLKKAKEASNSCKVINKSARAISVAFSKLEISSKILIDALPELVQKD